jgi:hypothetical protein
MPVRRPGDATDSPLARRRSTVCSTSSVITGGRPPDGSLLWGDEPVLESDPRRLVVTRRSLYDPALAAEQPSRVSWEIEPQDGGFCKLTVVHDQLGGAPKTAAHVAGSGWMMVLSGLKTLLETDAPLKGASPRRLPGSIAVMLLAGRLDIPDGTAALLFDLDGVLLDSSQWMPGGRLPEAKKLGTKQDNYIVVLVECQWQSKSDAIARAQA